MLVQDRPILEILKVDCIIINKKRILHANLGNLGKSAASNGKATFQVRDVVSQEVLIDQPATFGRVMPRSKETMTFEIDSSSRPFVIKTEISYEWDGFELPSYNELKYFLCTIDTLISECSCKSLTEELEKDFGATRISGNLEIEFGRGYFASLNKASKPSIISEKVNSTHAHLFKRGRQVSLPPKNYVETAGVSTYSL